MFQELYHWTKARLNTTNIANEDDELMETSDAYDQKLDLQA